MNVKKVKTNIARRIDPKGFQYHMTNVSWISSADSFYIKDMHKNWFYISAVELTLKKSKDYLDENKIENIDSMRIADNICINKTYGGIYEIKHIKQIILSQY
ncbi:hypothetical protein [Hymenobacter citatus]|nr:hypothetical protein [Hymenobacter citatus]